MPVAGRLGAQHGVTARGPRSSSGGLGRRGGGTGGEKGLWNAYPSAIRNRQLESARVLRGQRFSDALQHGGTMSLIDAWVAEAAKQKLVRQPIDLGPLGDEQVEVRVEHCGLCHSDLSMLDNDWGWSRFPAVLGHEVVGTVVEVGRAAKGITVGQRVGVGWTAESCMHCRRCLSGDHHMCAYAVPTIIGHHGGFASTLDLILVTANAPLDWEALFGALAPNGRLHLVGAVTEPIPVNAFSLITGQRSLSGSPVGSPVGTATMLDFAARHQVGPQTEHFPMSQINEAFDRLKSGKARYRIVLDADF
jgi:D-arabinose 1-dehydrogenase-like Zn-dependent alcohol dehydrogenase